MLKKMSWMHNRCKNRLETVGFDRNGICPSLNNNAFQSSLSQAHKKFMFRLGYVYVTILAVNF
jgi:hypothetical protein